jgi:hypothetical protein
MQANTIGIVEAALRRQDALLPEPIDLSRGADSPLYGPDGQVDSLTLVTALVDIEEQLHAQFGCTLHLADVSDLPADATPFASFGALCAHVDARLAAVQAAATL